jgi:hypothetical protein
MGERDVRLGARPADCPVDPHRPQADARPCTRRRPAHREESGNPNQVSADAAGHPYLPERQRGRRTGRCLRRPRRRGTDPGLHRLEIRSADRIERRGRRPRRPTHSCSPVDHPSWRQACRRQPEVCRRQAVRADPRAISSGAQGSTRWPPARRPGHRLTAMVAVGLEELEAGGQLEVGDLQDLPRNAARARSPTHLCVVITAGRRGPQNCCRRRWAMHRSR